MLQIITPLSMALTRERTGIQWMGFSSRILAKTWIPLRLNRLVFNVDDMYVAFTFLNSKFIRTHLTFHSSLEEHFAAATGQNTIVTTRGLIRANKTKLGRWSRSCWGCGWRRAYIWSHSRAKKQTKNSIKILWTKIYRILANIIFLTARNSLSLSSVSQFCAQSSPDSEAVNQ